MEHIEAKLVEYLNMETRTFERMKVSSDSEVLAHLCDKYGKETIIKAIKNGSCQLEPIRKTNQSSRD